MPAGAPEAALVDAFGMPAFLLPWADRFFEPHELALIAAMASGPRSVADVLRGLPGLTRADLERAHRRGILDHGDADPEEVKLADFHARYEVWAIFEGWKDVPDDVAERVNRWELETYVDSIRADLMAIKEGRPAEGGEAAYSYLLLPEAEELIAGRRSVFLWPCDCRAMYRRCAKPVNVCLRFQNDRGLGWESQRSAPSSCCAGPTAPASCTPPTPVQAARRRPQSATAAPTAAFRTWRAACSASPTGGRRGAIEPP